MEGQLFLLCFVHLCENCFGLNGTGPLPLLSAATNSGSRPPPCMTQRATLTHTPLLDQEVY